MKVIIAGTRKFRDYRYIATKLDKMLPEVGCEEIVSGMAPGPDSAAAFYGKEHGIPVTKMPADWDKYGKSAGYKRNTEMAKYADILIAFWDGKSRGTEHMISEMRRLGKKAYVLPVG